MQLMERLLGYGVESGALGPALRAAAGAGHIQVRSSGRGLTDGMKVSEELRGNRQIEIRIEPVSTAPDEAVGQNNLNTSKLRAYHADQCAGSDQWS